MGELTPTLWVLQPSGSRSRSGSGSGSRSGAEQKREKRYFAAMPTGQVTDFYGKETYIDTVFIGSLVFHFWEVFVKEESSDL
jgi:hypothetical protein